jgi:hypothetical protein
MSMFCPNCGFESYEEIEICPKCNFNIAEFSNVDFKQKLIKALNHPLPDVKIFAVQVIARKQFKDIIPVLTKYLKMTKDIYFKTALIEAIGELDPNYSRNLMRRFLFKSEALIVREAARKVLEK